MLFRILLYIRYFFTESIPDIIKSYKKVETHIKYLILAELFIQLLQSSFFLLMNYYMGAHGYEDYDIANMISYRFGAVFLLAFPMGLFIKGRQLKPFFLLATICMPICSLAVIYGISQQWDFGLKMMMMLWGASFLCIQVTALPFILLNAKPETHSEAISMFFQTWSVGICLVGLTNYILNNYNPVFFDEQFILYACTGLSFLSVFCILKINVKEQVSNKIPLAKIRESYDWDLIFKATIPTILIAIGAGFTIPVISLFFEKVHGVESDTFSLMGSFTYILVAIGMTFMPAIKKRFGYQIAITLFQSLAVLALFVMASTEYYNEAWYAIYIAVFFYIIRQPLMNVAGPMTSELTMYYVGKKNQEIISALNASIWSGSWFLSMSLFSYLRKMEWSYGSIFMITVVFYILGVVWYRFLIKEYNNRVKIIQV